MKNFSNSHKAAHVVFHFALRFDNHFSKNHTQLKHHIPSRGRGKFSGNRIYLIPGLDLISKKIPTPIMLLD